MTDKEKEKLHQILSSLWKNDDSVGKMCYNQALQDAQIAIDSLQEEPVSEELEEAAFDYAEDCKYEGGEKLLCVEHFKAGTKWQKNHLWKPADGDNLPEIDREVVVFTQDFPNDAGMMRIAIAHRPDPKGWDGKSVTTGKVEHYTPKTYDKGGWNIPDVKFWLDVELPKEIEL